MRSNLNLNHNRNVMPYHKRITSTSGVKPPTPMALSPYEVMKYNPLQYGLQIGTMGAMAGLGFATLQRHLRRQAGDDTPVSVFKPILLGALIGSVLGATGAGRVNQKVRDQLGTAPMDWDAYGPYLRKKYENIPGVPKTKLTLPKPPAPKLGIPPITTQPSYGVPQYPKLPAKFQGLTTMAEAKLAAHTTEKKAVIGMTAAILGGLYGLYNAARSAHKGFKAYNVGADARARKHGLSSLLHLGSGAVNAFVPGASAKSLWTRLLPAEVGLGMAGEMNDPDTYLPPGQVWADQAGYGKPDTLANLKAMRRYNTQQNNAPAQPPARPTMFSGLANMFRGRNA